MGRGCARVKPPAMFGVRLPLANAARPGASTTPTLGGGAVHVNARSGRPVDNVVRVVGTAGSVAVDTAGQVCGRQAWSSSS
jgi:hypothetical protein